MDQESAKKESAGTQSTWRDRLGIKKELPRIAAEFVSPSGSSSPERAEPSLAGPPARPIPVKPAPMAPRIVAAPKAVAPQGGANTDLAERIRQQREAAERMAEQRIVEAKERTIQPAPVPAPPSAQASQTPRPRFSFAEEELRHTRPDPAAMGAAAAQRARWNQAPQQRPIFAAERLASGPPVGSRFSGAPGGQRPGLSPGTTPPTPPPTGAATLRRASPSPRSLSSGSEFCLAGTCPAAIKPDAAEP